ncbi:DUF4374 domain-containing protein [Pontibacter cellulosilyticus]|uniref:DUF4374 domain-containing protein n=1 Tax=Pontibacter cellulosilyticus TaxID=1720253 RepID=A0A923N948_9BACT|nr:DUF4374 domain-containing protein [Pontibacter cellulosilyticus]MBC5993989.1 DUF4374 domain-containing protein [Pontibacter cellulosilyticus]
MFSITNARKLALPVLSLCSALLFTSCDSSNDDNPNPVEDDAFVVSLAVQGSDNSFTYYTVPYSDVMSGALSAKGQGIEQPGYFDFTQIDNTIYSIGGLGDVSVVGISKNEAGELKQIGNTSFTNSLSDIIKADDNTLVGVEMSSTSDMIKFHKINSNTVSIASTVQHPVSDITTLKVPSYSGMNISGNYLFLSYYISDPNTYATPHTDKAQIAVYTYPGLQFQRVIEDTRTGPIGGFNTKSGLIKDEQGNVYALSHSNPANGYSQTTKPAGILRIKSGETAFDQNYFFDVAAATGGKTISHLKYLGNGKAFAEINTVDRSQQAAWSDGPLKSAIIDLNSKTVTYISGLPEHAGNGRRLAALQDGKHVYMSIPEGNAIYMYRIDTESHTATKGAEVQANFVAGVSKL